MRSVKPFVSMKILKLIYYAYFHSIMSYGIKSLGYRKRIIRTMMGSRNRDSCRKLFKSLEILPLPSLYIFSLLQFVIKNGDLFTTNNEIHNLGTRQQHNLHHPSANLKKYQNRVFYMSIIVYNILPAYIKKEFTNPTKFISLVKKFLCESSFYSMDEFYNFCTMK